MASGTHQILVDFSYRCNYTLVIRDRCGRTYVPTLLLVRVRLT